MEGEEHPDIAVGLNHLASVLRDEGRLDEAENMFRQALAVGEHAWGPDQADAARIEVNLGDLLAKRGKLQESERLLRTALRSREKILPSNHPDIFDGQAKLGSVLAQEGRFQEAEPLLLSAWHGVDKASDSNSPSKQRILKEIVDMYAAWNRRTPEAGRAKLVTEWKAIESRPK